MAKKIIYCESCDSEFVISYKESKDTSEPSHCCFCGEEIDLDWNSDNEESER